MLLSFSFVWVGLTNSLNVNSKKIDQDIVNAMKLVDSTKWGLRKLRDDGWETHLNKVT